MSASRLLLHRIKRCRDFHLSSEGKKLHAHCIKSGAELHVPVFTNALLDMYGKCGLLDEAVQVFDEMPHRDFSSWASIFTAYNLANLPKYPILMFPNMMAVDGLQADNFVLASLVKACSNLSALRLGKQVHAYFLVSYFSDDDVVKSSIVDMYAKCGFPDVASRVFDSILCKNVVSWTSLLYGYARKGRKVEALEIFHKMPTKNVYTSSALISGFVQGGHSNDSVELFNELRRRSDTLIDKFVLSSLLSCSADAALLHLGKQVHGLVIELGFESNCYITNSLIDMYSKCSEVSSAEAIFHSTSNRDIVSWTSVIVGMAHHGLAHKALELYDEMILAGFRPNEVTFTGVIYGCSHAGLVEKGEDLFQSMVSDYGLRPSLQHYTCLVDLYARSRRLDEAFEVVNSMPFEPDEAVWATLLSSCCQAGRNELGVQIADHLLQVEPKETSTLILMSNIYAQAGIWESVSIIRKLLANLDSKKKPGFSHVDLGKESETFYAGDATTHPMKDEIFRLLKELDAEMRRRGYVPNISVVLHDMEEQEKERQLFWHSERLAVAYGLIKSCPGTTIRVLKNLRVCNDCHTVLKLISSITGRQLAVRDANRFHHFKDGECTCGDFW